MKAFNEDRREVDMKIVFATGNANKMVEVKAILGDMTDDIKSMKEAGIDIDIVEDGSTFEENALIKANAISKLLPGTVVLADDSGLEVDYLDKAPGIYSARWQGEDTPYSVKNAELLKRCEGVPEEKRDARFVCVIACAYPDGTVDTATGIIEGKLAHEAKGENGFGYDSLFWLPELGISSAEMSKEEKNDQ